MAPLTWTTTEQAEFLAGWLSKYLECTADKSYHRFWSEVYHEWFIRWPERTVLFLGVEGDLTAEQNKALGEAVDLRKKKLQTWFRWRVNASRSNRLQRKKTSVLEKMITPKGSRIRTPIELYMLEHYEDRIKPKMLADQQAGVIPAFGNNLNAVWKYAQGLLELEEDEIKEKVNLMYEMQERAHKPTCDPDEEVETDPIEIRRAIEDLPYMLTRVAKLIKCRTRYSVSFFCAGPDPSRNWDISSIFCHPDTTPEGHTFPELFPKENHAMNVAFQQFSSAVFPPDSRDPTTCSAEDDGVDVQEDVAITSEGESGVLAADEDDDGGGATTEISGHEDSSDNVEGDEIQKGDEGYGAAIAAGDRLQFSGDASYGTWVPSSIAAPPPSNQSTIQFNASTQPQSQLNFGINVGSEMVSGILGSHVPQSTPEQSVPSFASGSGSGAFGYDGSVDGTSFSAAMSDITAELSGHGWDFSGIGLDSFAPPPLSGIRSTQFGDVNGNPDTDFLPLPPIPNNPSPVRPCLPAALPPSPPAEQSMGTLPQTATVGSCSQTGAKRIRVLPPKRQSAKQTTAPPPPAQASNSSVQHGVLLEKPTTNPRPKPKIRQKKDALPDQQPVASTVAAADAALVPSQSQPPAAATDITTLHTSQVPVAERQPHGPTPSGARVSKRVPVQSKRNAIADAIGTNQPTFAQNGNCQGIDNQQAPPGTKKGKRSAETSEGAKKKKKAN